MLRGLNNFTGQQHNANGVVSVLELLKHTLTYGFDMKELWWVTNRLEPVTGCRGGCLPTVAVIAAVLAEALQSQSC